MELHTDPGLMREQAGQMLCRHYLARLAPASELHLPLSALIDVTPDMPPRQALAALHHALAGQHAREANPAYGSLARRLQLFRESPRMAHAPSGKDTNTGLGRCSGTEWRAAPQINRSSMAPHPWGRLNPVARWIKSALRRPHQRIARQPHSGTRQPWPAAAPAIDRDDITDAPDPRGDWQYSGNIRRIVLLLLMLAQTGLATYFMRQVLPYQGAVPLEFILLALFAVLFCWVSAGFWTAMAGFWVLLRGRDRFASSCRGMGKDPIAPDARTAIVMPICNEDVTRVIAGLRATYESVARSGELDRFDFFILSDSNDSDTCSAEAAAWGGLCRAVEGYGRIFYRRRRRRVKRKSGNIDDFCRRWGKNYRYMVVLDADSVMSGACLTSLVRLMEAHPGAGIIQTAPRAVGRETLYARMQQFSICVYGPLFTAGLYYWQLGESHYWGHNAIIRVAPFIRHCALASLPGRGALAGEILSHDFVEAALMRRAGWAVWIAYDLDGSYEETPPNLLDELKRDRRWCHGNLMNFRLFAARGMHPVHRVVFASGVMAYLSAPIWFLFLALSTAMLALHTLVEPQYFHEPRQLFPIWPQWHPEEALALFSATAALLFLPKILSVLLLCVHAGHQVRQFGGRLRLMTGMLIELFLSVLLAPVRMLFHTLFVLSAYLGWAARWKSPPRQDSETGWAQAARKHGLPTLLGLAWGAGVFWLKPAFLPWLLPIAGALALSIPLSVWSSRVSLGRRFRRARLFLIPEESEPPPELAATVAHIGAAGRQADFVDAVIDPIVNALACMTAPPRPHLPASVRQARIRLTQAALRAGPAALTEVQKQTLLNDPLLLSQLHFDVWTSAEAHAQWRASVNRSIGQPVSRDGNDAA